MEAGNILLFIVLVLSFSSLLVLLRGQTGGKTGGRGRNTDRKRFKEKKIIPADAECQILRFFSLSDPLPAISLLKNKSSNHQ